MLRLPEQGLRSVLRQERSCPAVARPRTLSVRRNEVGNVASLVHLVAAE